MKIDQHNVQFDESLALKIRNNIKIIKEKITKTAEKVNRNFNDITLVAVTKTVDYRYVNIAIEEGITTIGENVVQEFKRKYANYNKEGLNIHFIGHLQSRKVKDIIGIVDVIESVDSIKLANIISKRAGEIKKNIPIFLEINIDREETKFGFYPEDIFYAIENISRLDNIKIVGLMCIPPRNNSRHYFDQMKSIYIDICSKKIDNVNMKFLSMGMSNDFEEAIMCGANVVRIGRFLFGDR